MASKTTKVRLVRCPKCLKVLPELAHLPVYQCGGCGITLKAKRRIEDQEGESSEALDQNSAQKNESENDVEDKESTSSSQKAIVRSTVGCEQLDYQDCAKEKSVSRRNSNEIDSSGELDRHEKEEFASTRIPNGIDSSRELDHQEKEESSSVAGGSRKPDRTNDRGFDLENSTPDNSQGISGGGNFTSASQKPFVESVPSKICASSVSEELETEKIVRRYAGLIGSKGSVKTAEATFDNIVSEDDLVGNKLKDTPVVSKPPAAKSHHAYDASISSNDGWGDQVSDFHSHQSKRSLSGSERVAELINTNATPTRDDVSVNNMIGAKSEVQNQSRKLSLMSVNEKHDSVVVGSVSLDQDELPENTGYGIQDQKQVRSRDATSLNPVQSWLGLERGELKTKKLFGQRNSSAGYENCGPSKYRRNELSRSSMFPPKKLESVERDQMELLRKVDELRDQLNRSYVHSRTENERFLTKSNQQERQRPLYYNQNLPNNDVRYDVNFPRQSLGTNRPSKSMPFQCGYSQMPLSGNLVNCRHHANCSCSNAYKEEWQCLQQLPPPNLCCSEGFCGEYLGHVCYNSYNSSLSSPEQPLHSRYPLRCPYDQIDRDQDVENLHPRERRQPVKRHCRPMAGGAPFIICYNCRKVLYLPADSLLSSKGCHRLQCGSCSKVLVFSFQKRNHIAPHPQNSAVPSQGVAHNSSAPTSMSNSVSTFLANDDPQGDPMSYSEDLSICNSDSTEGGLAFLMTGFSAAKRNAVDRKQPSSRLIKPVEKMKEGPIAEKSGNKQKNFIQASDSGSPSFDEARVDKLQSEDISKKPIGLPLHQLMGYSSFRKLLYESGS